jgi:hypothetical protein
MKSKTYLFGIFTFLTLASMAQTNAVHKWTLKSGAVFPGDYFTSGTQMVVIKSHGTNCLLKILELSTNDWLYFQECKAAQRQTEMRNYLASMTNRLVRVTAVLDEFGMCNTTVRTIYLEGLPQNVTDFLNRQAQLKGDVETLRNTTVTAWATVRDPNDPDPAFTSQLAAQNALANAQRAHDNKLQELKEELSEMNAAQSQSTSVIACPTGLTYNGIPRWRCASQ